MFFKKKQPPGVSEPASTSSVKALPLEWNLPAVTEQLTHRVANLETKEIEPYLVQARLADHYRDLDLEPPLPAQFYKFVVGLDGESWRRLALAIGPLDDPEIRSVLALLPTPVVQQVQAGFVAMARKTDALTLSLIRPSEVRTEEFARHLAAFLGISWSGETTEQSKARLHLLDYKRLLAEAQRAKAQAEDRMEYLRKKQEEDAARRRPRGKQ